MRSREAITPRALRTEKDSARFVRGNVSAHRYLEMVSTFQFTFVKMHFSGRSMPRVLMNGEVVRAEVLPRQRAHQDPPQGREGAAGNLSIHFASSHIIRVSSVSTRVRDRCNIPGENTSNPRPAWFLLMLHRSDITRVPERTIKLGCRQLPRCEERLGERRIVRVPLDCVHRAPSYSPFLFTADKRPS